MEFFSQMLLADDLYKPPLDSEADSLPIRVFGSAESPNFPSRLVFPREYLNTSLRY